jgi:uncharacterized protein DUF1259
MKTHLRATRVVVFALVVALTRPVTAHAVDPDWKAVEQALGASGQMQPGDVFRIGMPRTDLTVTVKGVPVKPGFALGSYAAFKQVGDHAMVMGDLVLLDQEVPAAMSGLLAGGLEVTAVHNHLNEMSPHVMYMHYGGHGDAVQMARALRQALSASGTPLGGPASTPAAATGPTLDTKAIEQSLGRSGRDIGGGVFQVTVPRAETVTEMGQTLLPGMGVVTVMNFQPTRRREGGDHGRLRADRQGSESGREDPSAARRRRHRDPQPRAHGHAAAVLHAFLGQRRPGEAGRGPQGRARPDEQPEVGSRTRSRGTLPERRRDAVAASRTNC